MRLSIILVAVVAVFLVCHAPRVILNVYEIIVHLNSRHCLAAKKIAFWAHLLLAVLGPLLALNSSVNILIYAGLSREFKEALTCFWRKKRTLTTYGEGNEHDSNTEDNGEIELNTLTVRDTTVALI